MRLYAITDRRLFPGDERERCAALLRQAGRWVSAGVEFIQLREKDLAPAALEELAGRLVELAHGKASASPSRILINAPGAGAVAIARKVGADGVHLPGRSLAAGVERVMREELVRVREGWPAAGRRPVVSVACHSAHEVAAASAAGASLILFAPVFEKPVSEGVLPGVGLDGLRDACLAAGAAPVFALGGVSVANVAECVAAGAAGVAGIRLFVGDAWLRPAGR